jgi:hypothetical protein
MIFHRSRTAPVRGTVALRSCQLSGGIWHLGFPLSAPSVPTPNRQSAIGMPSSLGLRTYRRSPKFAKIHEFTKNFRGEGGPLQFAVRSSQFAVRSSELAVRSWQFASPRLCGADPHTTKHALYTRRAHGKHTRETPAKHTEHTKTHADFSMSPRFAASRSRGAHPSDALFCALAKQPFRRNLSLWICRFRSSPLSVCFCSGISHFAPRPSHLVFVSPPMPRFHPRNKAHFSVSNTILHAVTLLHAIFQGGGGRTAYHGTTILHPSMSLFRHVAPSLRLRARSHPITC